MVGFVNGLPLVVVELKKPGVPARAAFNENLTYYKQQIPALFWFNALLIASNGTNMTGVCALYDPFHLGRHRKFRATQLLTGAIRF